MSRRSPRMWPAARELLQLRHSTRSRREHDAELADGHLLLGRAILSHLGLEVHLRASSVKQAGYTFRHPWSVAHGDSMGAQEGPCDR